MTRSDAELAPANTTLGQLQRGRGLGWLADREASNGDSLLATCLSEDPRWDSQVESRESYYALLALELGFPASEIDPEAVDDEHTKWLRIGVLTEMAERGDEAALALMRDRVMPGLLAEDIVWRLTDLSGGRGLEGLENLILERFDDDQLQELISDRRRSIPWDEWGKLSERIRRVTVVVDDERDRSRGDDRLRPPKVDAPVGEILEHDWGPVPPKALIHRLVNLATPDEVELIRDAASRPWDSRGHLPMFVLGRRGDSSAVNVAEDVFVRGVWGGERASAFRYLSDLDPFVTLPLAREWITTEDDRQNIAARLLALHAESVDAPVIRRVLEEGFRTQAMYVVCDLVDALARLDGSGPFPEVRAIFEETVYSYARRRAALAMAATDPEFSLRYATECLWDCDAETREVGVSRAPATPQVVDRVRQLAVDQFEDSIVASEAERRLEAFEFRSR